MTARRLCHADVQAIRSSRHTQEALAAEFGVSTSTVSNVQRGKSYREVPWPERSMVGAGLCPRCRAEARYQRARQSAGSADGFSNV